MNKATSFIDSNLLAGMLKDFMKREGLTQAEAAEKLRVSQALVSSYLHKKHRPSPRVLEHMAPELGYTYSQLLGLLAGRKAGAAVEQAAARRRKEPSFGPLMRGLRRRWKRYPADRKEIELAIDVLFPQESDRLILWIKGD